MLCRNRHKRCEVDKIKDSTRQLVAGLKSILHRVCLDCLDGMVEVLVL